jgi:hypothetical protein
MLVGTTLQNENNELHEQKIRCPEGVVQGLGARSLAIPGAVEPQRRGRENAGKTSVRFNFNLILEPSRRSQ